MDGAPAIKKTKNRCASHLKQQEFCFGLIRSHSGSLCSLKIRREVKRAAAKCMFQPGDSDSAATRLCPDGSLGLPGPGGARGPRGLLVASWNQRSPHIFLIREQLLKNQLTFVPTRNLGPKMCTEAATNRTWVQASRLVAFVNIGCLFSPRMAGRYCSLL